MTEIMLMFGLLVAALAFLIFLCWVGTVAARYEIEVRRIKEAEERRRVLSELVAEAERLRMYDPRENS